MPPSEQLGEDQIDHDAADETAEQLNPHNDRVHRALSYDAVMPVWYSTITHCGNGHPLAHPNGMISWDSCSCPKAVGRPKGHQQLMCWTCRWQVRENGCDRLVDGHVRG